MSQFKILIVEDEILIADTIKKYLLAKDYEVSGIAISYEEAITSFTTEKPDLVILDIRLSGAKTGIDVGKYINEQASPVPIIYLTSQFDTSSIEKAKDTFPSGYLTKPIRRDTLLASIEIAIHNFNERQENEAMIQLKSNTTNYAVPVKDILYLEAEHIYVTVKIANGQSILQRGSLKELLEQLPADQFIQSHRSFAINKKHVDHWDANNLYVQNKSIPISRSRRKEVISRLKLT